jgi:hypothetical protein
VVEDDEEESKKARHPLRAIAAPGPAKPGRKNLQEPPRENFAQAGGRRGSGVDGKSKHGDPRHDRFANAQKVLERVVARPS